MTTIRIVVQEIEAGKKNDKGGRTITISGPALTKGIGHCALTFATAAELDRLRAAIDSK